MVEALIAGERNPVVLAEMSKSRMRAKKDELTLALDGNFAAYHGVVAQQVIDHVAFLDESIATLSAAIRERLAGFEPVMVSLCPWLSGPPISASFASIASLTSSSARTGPGRSANVSMRSAIACSVARISAVVWVCSRAPASPINGTTSGEARMRSTTWSSSAGSCP